MKLTEREKAIYQVTWAGSFVNFLLVIFKFIAGILGHSAAMIADAIHYLILQQTSSYSSSHVFPINRKTKITITAMANTKRWPQQ